MGHRTKAGAKKHTYEGKTPDGYVLRARAFLQEPRAWMWVGKHMGHWYSICVQPQKRAYDNPQGLCQWIECVMIK